MAVTSMVILFALALILILLSTWTLGSFFYYAILFLLAGALVIDLIQAYYSRGVWDWESTGVDLLLFGFVFYFVTSQNVMGRKVFDIPSRDALRAHFLENNAYRGWRKGLVFMPAALILIALCWAIYWKFIAVATS